MIEIAKEDRAYFAGLFDGEGSVGIQKSEHKTPAGNTTVGYSLRVHFSLTYKPVLIRMQKLFGGNIHTTNMEKRKNNKSVKKLAATNYYSSEKWKQLYIYYLNSRDALYFLKVIEPFCDEKRPQVLLAIQYEQGKRSHAGSYGRSERETERCGFFYQELKRLKHEQPDEYNIETDFEDNQQSLFSFEVEV